MSTQMAVRKLGRDEIDAILSRNHIGRLAYCWRDRVDIRPVHYVHRDGVLYGRTSEGAKLQTLRHNWSVAFEVDEVRGPFDWRSVVVLGGFYRIDSHGSPGAPERYAAAMETIRSVAPEALGSADPAPNATSYSRS